MKADYVHKDSRTLEEKPQVFTRWIDPTIEELKQENKQLKIQISAREKVCNRLESNWNKLKEYLNYKSERAVGEDEYVYDELIDKMQELEQGSDSNE